VVTKPRLSGLYCGSTWAWTTQFKSVCQGFNCNLWPVSELFMNQRVVEVAATCYHHLCWLRQICRWQRSDNFSDSRTNRVHNGLLQLSTGRPIIPLQHEQNATARLVFELSIHDLVTASIPILLLHLLPVHCHILFKLCCIMHSVFHRTCPAHLANIVQLSSASHPHSSQHHRHQRTGQHCHSCAPSLTNALSHMPIRQHGTHYLGTSEPRPTPQTQKTVKISLF